MKKQELNSIIVKIQNGNQRYLSELLDRVRRKTIQVIRKFNFCYDESEEVVEEVSIKVFEKIAMFNPERACFDAWLSRIAYNQSVDMVRKKKRLREAALNEAEYVDCDIESLFLPAEESESAVKEEKVKKLISKLDNIQQEIIRLRYYEDMDYKEISELLHVTENHAAVIHSRAMARLRSLAIAA